VTTTRRRSGRSPAGEIANLNPWQFAQQLAHELAAVSWQAEDGEPVFGPRGVYVYAGELSAEEMPLGFPFALVRIGDASADTDDPDLLEQSFAIVTVAQVAGDRLGSAAVRGGGTNDLGKSANRGAAELLERVQSAVGDLTGADGCKVLLSTSSASATQVQAPGRHIAFQQLDLTATCTASLQYASPQWLRFVAEDNVWRWEGRHCSSRYDFVQFRLVRKAGTSPSTDPSDGTLLYTGTAPEYVGPSISNYTYTVFADYSARGAGIEGTSTPERGAWRTDSAPAESLSSRRASRVPRRGRVTSSAIPATQVPPVDPI
jgi:hypothetical protein